MNNKIMFFLFLLGYSMQIDSIEMQKAHIKTTEFSFIVKAKNSGELGLFAIHDIPAGTQILDEPFKLRIMKIKDVPVEFYNFILPLNDEECAAPERFDRLEAGWYMNISSTNANVAKKLEGPYATILEVLEANTFYAIRDIRAGEEILIDVEQVKQYFPHHD